MLSCYEPQPECHQSQTDSSSLSGLLLSSSSLTDLFSEGQRKINELIADRGNVSDTAAFLSPSSCNHHHHFLFSTQSTHTLSLSRSFWIGLEDIPAAVHPPFFSPSGCLEVKTSLFQMWEPQGILGIQRIWGYSTVCCEFRQCGVHCVLVKVVFSYYRFS